eukprot:1823931-Rhodomonas_salina.3
MVPTMTRSVTKTEVSATMPSGVSSPHGTCAPSPPTVTLHTSGFLLGGGVEGAMRKREEGERGGREQGRARGGRARESEREKEERGERRDSREERGDIAETREERGERREERGERRERRESAEERGERGERERREGERREESQGGWGGG